MDNCLDITDESEDRGLKIRRFFVFIMPVIVIAATILGLMTMAALKPKPVEKEDTIKAAPVLVAEARREGVRLSITAQGEAKPRTQINLVPQVSGKVVYVSPKFKEGGSFKEGDVLLRVDPTEYQLRVVQARANVAQARTRLQSEEAEAAIARNEAIELGLDETTSALAMREPQLAEARAMINSAEAALGEAELHLARTSIVAPFDGRIQSKAVDFGQYVTPGVELAKIFAVDIMEIALPLTDNELGQLGLSIGFAETASQQGPEVKLSANVGGMPHDWTGRITHTDSGYDPSTRVLFAYVSVEDPYGVAADDGVPLASGLFVTAAVQGRMIENSVVAPRSALRGKDRVYVAQSDNTLAIKYVTVASTDRDQVVITAGLSGGERVITSPIRGVADGMVIEVVDRSSSDDGISLSQSTAN